MKQAFLDSIVYVEPGRVIGKCKAKDLQRKGDCDGFGC